MAHAFVDSVSTNVANTERAKQDAAKAAEEERKGELDLAELTAEAIAATEAAESSQEALSTARKNMLYMQTALRAAHRGEIAFLRNLLEANPLLCASNSAAAIQQRVQLLEQQTRTLAPGQSRTAQPNTSSSSSGGWESAEWM